jgi:hypothetical protein
MYDKTYFDILRLGGEEKEKGGLKCYTTAIICTSMILRLPSDLCVCVCVCVCVFMCLSVCGHCVRLRTVREWLRVPVRRSSPNSPHAVPAQPVIKNKQYIKEAVVSCVSATYLSKHSHSVWDNTYAGCCNYMQ